jgi:DNA-binding beta-propeller fold protein YncE
MLQKIITLAPERRLRLRSQAKVHDRRFHILHLTNVQFTWSQSYDFGLYNYNNIAFFIAKEKVYVFNTRYASRGVVKFTALALYITPDRRIGSRTSLINLS